MVFEKIAADGYHSRLANLRCKEEKCESLSKDAFATKLTSDCGLFLIYLSIEVHVVCLKIRVPHCFVYFLLQITCICLHHFLPLLKGRY